MLQRDYIKRLIREFAEALRRMLDQKEVVKRREAIRLLYEQYLGPYNLYHFATIDELMSAILSFTEASVHDREVLLQKAFNLFEYLERESGVYSMERRGKMAELMKQLANAPYLVKSELATGLVLGVCWQLHRMCQGRFPYIMQSVSSCFMGFNKFSWVDGMSWAHALVVTKRRTVQELNLRPCGLVVHLIRSNC